MLSNRAVALPPARLEPKADRLPRAKVVAGIGDSERDERHREHHRNRQGHHQPGAQTKAQETDGEHGFANLEYRLGDIEDPPIEKGTIDPPS